MSANDEVFNAARVQQFGARPSKKPLSSLGVEGPKRGRKPKGHPLEGLLILAQQFDVTVADLVNVRGFRASKTLTDRKTEPPKVGRKPRGGR